MAGHIVDLQVFLMAQWFKKNPPANAGGTGSIPGSGRSLGKRNGNPFPYSCLGNPMDRGAWGATDHGVAKRHSLATKQQQQ